ncbi:MAG: His/Gly/Thr/Pro-type tRNA ligase C-terminal domain-containing protein, partial [Candidatus Heimdallarchaeaceae archaeon]
GLRVDVDLSTERMEYKIRQAQLHKIPYMISVGDKEVENETLAVRTRDGKVEYGVKVEDFIKQVKKKISSFQ